MLMLDVQWQSLTSIFHYNYCVVRLLSTCICVPLLQKLVDVQEFLKLPPMNLTSRQVKIHQGSLTQHIMNWDDVNKTLQGTTYESFLGADY